MAIKVNAPITRKIYSDVNDQYIMAETIAAPGKLVLIHVKPGEDGFFMRDGVFKPIIISETEKIEVGDKIWSKVDDRIETVLKITDVIITEYSHTALDVTGNYKLYKIIALPEHFSPKQLQAIVYGKMKDGDEVYVECMKDGRYRLINPADPECSMEEFISNGQFNIRLNSDNHITLHKVERVCSHGLEISKHEQKLYTREEVVNLLNDLNITINKTSGGLALGGAAFFRYINQHL